MLGSAAISAAHDSGFKRIQKAVREFLRMLILFEMLLLVTFSSIAGATCTKTVD